MKLNDPLVDSFEFEGVEYAIDLSFDNVLDAFDMQSNEELDIIGRAYAYLYVLTGVEFEHIDVDALALKKFIDETFIGEKEEVVFDRKGNPMPAKPVDKYSDVVKDAEFIYASFVQAYGINLLKVQGELSWVEFKALLNGLPKDTIMQQIIQIRSYTPSKNESSEYKNNMKKLQIKFSLHGEEEEYE